MFGLSVDKERVIFILKRLFHFFTEFLWISAIVVFLLFLYDVVMAKNYSPGSPWDQIILNWCREMLSGENLPSFFYQYTFHYILFHNLLITLKLTFLALFILIATGLLFVFLIHYRRYYRLRYIVNILKLLSVVHPIYYCVLFVIVGFTFQTGTIWPLIIVLAVSGGLFMNFFHRLETGFTGIMTSDYMVALKVLGENPLKYVIKPYFALIVIEVRSIFPIIIASSMFIEYFFTIQGTGYLLQLAFSQRAIQVMLYVALSIVIIIIVVNFLLEVVLYQLNPTLKYKQR